MINFIENVKLSTIFFWFFWILTHVQFQFLLLPWSFPRTFAIQWITWQIELTFAFFLFLQLHLKVLQYFLIQLMSISKPVLPLDSFNQNIISVFNRMFWSDSLKFSWNKCPSTSIRFYHGKKLHIFFKCPISFFDIWIEMTYPFLSAHREGFKEFSFWLTIELIGYCLPLRLVFLGSI